MAKAIVFDLDGTLIDSAPDLHVALNTTLIAEGVAPVTLAETIGFIGHGIPQLVNQARAFRGIDPARQEGMVGAMFAAYLAKPSALTQPYPGAVACLQGLRERGFAIGLCTNKALAPTLDILKDLDLAQYFDHVTGGDSLAQKKPDPAPLLACFNALGAPVLYVGDSEVDAQTAANAGLRFALYTQGYRRTPVDQMPQDFAFAEFGDLIRYIDGLE